MDETQPVQANDIKPPTTPWSIVRKVLFVIKRTCQLFGALLLAYFLFVAIGLIPTNPSYVEPDEGIDIYLISNAVHADIIVPLNTDAVDWQAELEDFDFTRRSLNATHIAFGWGDRGFYVETPTWNEFKVSTAVNALLLPSDTCMHVAYTRKENVAPYSQRIRLTPDQYKQLVQFIRESFASDPSGNFIEIEAAGYANNDAFFVGAGRYHALNTCNSWVGTALKRADLRVPLWSPLPSTPAMYLPDSREND